MKLFERIARLFKSEVNSALDNMEDSVKLYKLRITEMVEKARQIEIRRIDLLASKRELECQRDKLLEEATALKEEAAKMAADGFRANQIAPILARRNDKLAAYKETITALENVTVSETRCREAHEAQLSQIEMAKTKLRSFSAKIAAADAIRGVAEFTDTVDPADDIEVDVRRKLFEAEAAVEVHGDPTKRYQDPSLINEAQELINSYKKAVVTPCGATIEDVGEIKA